MNLESVYHIKWSSPSNIALVKYWGKHGVQLPQNPSISFTLKNSLTNLSLEIFKSEAPGLSFSFHGQANAKFEEKIAKFLSTKRDRFPWLENHFLKMDSTNTFPHSSGIASSASSMSALALCLLSADEFFTGKKYRTEDFLKEASELARLASGSASRSVYPGMAIWGELKEFPHGSNDYATPFTEAHPIFRDYCDSILIVDAGEKSVSSRAGHSLMENHLFKDERYKQARRNLSDLIVALKAGDLVRFIEIVEEEALTLHALMMTSRPSYILLKPESLWLINEIKSFREKEKVPVCFTIDAGPNIHLLYPKSHALKVREWIDAKLSEKLSGIKCLHDEVGEGPSLL